MSGGAKSTLSPKEKLRSRISRMMLRRNSTKWALGALLVSILSGIPTSAQAAYCSPIISYVGGYTIETFTATAGCTWTTPLNVYSADVLVVGAGAGGGGGAFDNQYAKSGGGGGGGAGAVIAHTISLTPNTSTNIVVGSGGTGGAAGYSSGSWGGVAGTTGGQSVFLSDTSTGGFPGLGGGNWDLISNASTRCNTSRTFFWGGYNIYYIDGVGGLGGYSGSANGAAVKAGGYAYCSTSISVAVGSAGGSGGGSSASALDGRTSGDTLTAQPGGAGTPSNISGNLITYAVGGVGGNGGAAGGDGANGSTPGTGGSGGAGAITGSAGVGGAGADGIIVIKFQAQTNVALSLSGNSTTAIYRALTPITATLLGSNGYVTFYANKVIIPGCKRVVSSNLVATCNWKPQYRGTVTITASINPSTMGYPVTSNARIVTISNRTGKR